jgi:hypothetical protein
MAVSLCVRRRLLLASAGGLLLLRRLVLRTRADADADGTESAKATSAGQVRGPPFWHRARGKAMTVNSDTGNLSPFTDSPVS